jgi:hypothetical protein
MTLYDLKFWLRGVGLVAIPIGLALAIGGHSQRSPQVDPIFYSVSAVRVAISSGLFRTAGIVTFLGGVVLVTISHLNIGARKK